MTNHYYTVEDLMLDESFIRYCLKSDAADVIKWESITGSHPDLESVFTEAEQFVILLHSGLFKEEVDTELQHIQSKILSRQRLSENKEEVPEKVIAFPKRKPSNKWLYAGIAASLLVGVFLFFGYQNQSASHSTQLAVYTVSSLSDSHKKVFLPDGTEVTLNSNSSISWNEAFNQKDRQINLTGSAFFKVAKNAQKPFTVHSASLSTTALGTAFYVQQLPSDNGVQVSLLEGKINVEEEETNQQKLVYPGEEIVYSAASHSLQKQKFNTASLDNWLHGELLFTNLTLKDAIRELSFWYNKNIQLQNASLSEKTVTGVYQNAPLDDVLKVMSFSLRFTYTTSGNTIVIH